MPSQRIGSGSQLRERWPTQGRVVRSVRSPRIRSASVRPARFAAALEAVLDDHDLRASLGRRAYDHSRGMIWSEVGAAYARVFDRAALGQPVLAAAATRVPSLV